MEYKATRSQIDALPVFPYSVTNFISQEQTQQLLLYLNTEEANSGFGNLDIKEYWQGRTLDAKRIVNTDIRDMFREIRFKITTTIQQLLDIHLGPQPPLYVDLINFARWPVGYELRPHADNENPDGSPHRFTYRDFGSVIYLNNDYGGGEIFFPNQDITLKPVPGTFMVFPGTLQYLHGIRPVTSGTRHTIATFITFDQTKEYRIF